MPEPHSPIVKAWTFRPMTRLAMVIERLAAESGHSAASIISHVGYCPYRNSLLRVCRSFMFNAWESWDCETGQSQAAERGFAEREWAAFSPYLLADFGKHATCPNCDEPCHPVLIDRYERELKAGKP